VILAIAATCGVFVGMRRAPSMLDTAIEVDRQLHSPDLLSTALLAPDRPDRFVDRSFASAVLRLADARVAEVSPTDLLLRRFTPRAWSGIGMAVASVVTLAMLVTTSPPETRARPATIDRPSFSRAADPNSDHRTTTGDATSSRRPDHRTTDVRHASQIETSEERDSREAATAQRDQRDQRDQRGSARQGNGAGGAGSSRTNDLREMSAAPSSPELRDAPLTSSDPTSPAEAGIGRAARDATAGSARPGTVAPGRGSGAVPPWSAETWPTDRDAARHAVRAGTIPPAYRDLVRDYFDLE
jgi:hypothetical protein